MLRRLAKIAAWSLGALLALALILYAVLFAANREDRPPSAEITVLKSLQERPSPVLSPDNSYIFMLGFAGPPDIDPMELGLERYQWMQIAGPGFEQEGDPLAEKYGFRALRDDSVVELAQACSESEANCAELLASREEALDQWLAGERWLLDRYRSLIRLPEFAEATPHELQSPLPPFDVMLDGQRLLMADAWVSANLGDATAVSAALDRDLAYWRLVLTNAEVLISKMIATAAIIHHFKFGNVVLRRLPGEIAADGIPMSWRSPISDVERSMKRSLAGEWLFFETITMRIGAEIDNPFGTWVGLEDYSGWDRAAWVLMHPFWQPQDLCNRYARLMRDLGNTFEVPYEEVAEAIDAADDLQAAAFNPFGGLYNLTGNLVMSGNYWSFSDYAARVADLEGIRRAALLAAELRAAGVSRNEVVQHMQVSELVDPYTNDPFAWHDHSDAITFYGLEPYDRATHELIY